MIFVMTKNLFHVFKDKRSGQNMPKHLVSYFFLIIIENLVKAFHVPITRSSYHEMCSSQTYLIHLKKGPQV